MNGLKIVLVTRVYPTLRPGGLGHVVQDRANALAEMGNEVFVLTTGQSPAGDVFQTPEGVTVMTAPGVEPGTYCDAFARWLTTTANFIDPHVLHLDSFDNRRPWWTSVNKHRTGRTGCTLHGFGLGTMLTNIFNSIERLHPFAFPSPDHLAAVRSERDCLKTFDRVIAISLNEWWCLRDGMSLGNTAFIPNPIAPYFFTPVNRHPPKKGRQFVTGAITRMHGKRQQEVVEICKRNGWGITLATKYRREDMPSLYDQATALVFPSLYFQAASLMVDEALARGCPVIGFDRGPFAFDERPGIARVPPGDFDLLERTMAAPLPARVTQCDDNRPDNHAKQWLEEMCG